MGKRVLTLAVAALFAAPVAAQQAWQTEVGIQGGFTRWAPAGMGKSFRSDLIDLPGSGGFGRTSIYAVLPWRRKIAIEPSFVVSQGSYGLGFTRATIGLRGDYAFTPKIYGAAGAVLNWADDYNQHKTHIGAQLGVGYRVRLGPSLNGRVEAQWQYAKVPMFPWWNNSYSLLFGVATPTHRAAARARASGAGGHGWEPMLGIQGGYSRIHDVHNGDYAFVTLPFWGAANVAATMEPIPFLPLVLRQTQPTLYAIFPLGSRLAIEPALDLHRNSANGGAVFLGNVSARLDYAVSDHWYAAAGGNLVYFKARQGYPFFVNAGISSTTSKGANVAWGYRFHIGEGLGGRLEASYIMMARNHDLSASLPYNITNISFGLSAPLR